MWDMRKTWGTVLCAGLLLSACTDDDGSDLDHSPADSGTASEPDRMVGAVDDSDIVLGVVANLERARLFFCGGASSYATATKWFNLDFDGEQLEANDGSWHLRATRGEDGISGMITHDPDDGRPFSARPVANETLAGLYEGKAGCGRLGLIVTQADKNAQPTAQGACVGDDHDPEQVNPIEPIASQQGKVRVQAPAEDAMPLLGAATLKPL
jgi:hypothetical protein